MVTNLKNESKIPIEPNSTANMEESTWVVPVEYPRDNMDSLSSKFWEPSQNKIHRREI
jgi:hypothetical protein